MIGTLVAASWLVTSTVSSVALGRFRFSVIAKYTAPLHLISLCIAALFLFWQTIAYLLAINLGLAFAASHVFGQFKEDLSAELPDLKNQLEVLRQGPPYNFLCGRFYPKESLAPFAAVAHTIDLIWRYLNRTPRPNVQEARQRLEEKVKAIYNRLRAVKITDAGVLPAEKELLYWVTYISPIDPRYTLDTKTALLHVRILLGEPLPTADLRKLVDKSVIKGHPRASVPESPDFPEVKAWVFVYNKEPALEIEHLAKAFTELWDEDKARKILFILMRDYGLCPDKHPKTYIPGLESIDKTSAPAAHHLHKCTRSGDKFAPMWTVKESGAGLAYTIQSEYILPQELFEQRQTPSDAKKQSSTYASPIQDRMNWLAILRRFQEYQVIPVINWDKSFVVFNRVPYFLDPFFTSRHIDNRHKNRAQDKWREEVTQSLLESLNPFDGRDTTLWRLFLLHHLSKKTTENDAIEYLCQEPRTPYCWKFAYKQQTPQFTGRFDCVPIYKQWRPQVNELVDEVKRRYQLTDDEVKRRYQLTDNDALRCIAQAFHLEWQDTSSPLRAIAFIKQWPVNWWLQVFERSVAKCVKSASQAEDCDTLSQLCAP